MGSQRYRVLIGFNYPAPGGKGEIRHEPEEIVDDLPAHVVANLAATGAKVLEAYPPPPPGSLSVVEEAGALTVLDEPGKLSLSESQKEE